VSIALVCGAVVGIAAGYYRGGVDRTVTFLTDVILAVPALLFLVALGAIWGKPTSVGEAVVKLGLGLGVVMMPTVVRLARGNTIGVAQREFIAAAKVLGVRDRRIMRCEVLPNVVTPLLAYAFVLASIIIFAEGTLSFLGLGLQAPKPSWGSMIAESGTRELDEHPQIVVVPGVLMLLTVCSLSQVGEHLRLRWLGLGRSWWRG